jgi:hypothetical protein
VERGEGEGRDKVIGEKSLANFPEMLFNLFRMFLGGNKQYNELREFSFRH